MLRSSCLHFRLYPGYLNVFLPKTWSPVLVISLFGSFQFSIQCSPFHGISPGFSLFLPPMIFASCTCSFCPFPAIAYTPSPSLRCMYGRLAYVQVLSILQTQFQIPSLSELFSIFFFWIESLLREGIFFLSMKFLDIVLFHLFVFKKIHFIEV